MTDHLSNAQLDRYRRGGYRGQEMLDLDLHVTQCTTCRGNLQTAPVLAEAERRWRDALSEESHLSFEALSALLHGADDASRDHLDTCSQCRDELEDLGRFRREMHWRRRRWLSYAAAAAIVVVVTGSIVAIVIGNRAGQTAQQPVPPQRARIVPPAKDVLRDGTAVYQLRPDGTIADLDPRWQEVIAAVLARRQPDILASLNPPGGRTRGSSASSAPPIELERPRGQVVADDRPHFRWTARAGVDRVRVEVFDARFELVASSPWLTDASWQPALPLPRGEVLSWQLVVQDGERRLTFPRAPTPSPRFQILAASVAAELEGARRRDSRLMAGLIYAREGMIDEARAEFAELARQNPAVSLAQRLAQSSEALAP